MTTIPQPDPTAQSISEEAAAWRITLGAPDPRRVPQFWQWVTRSPQHVHEALVMGLLNRTLQDVDPDATLNVRSPSALAVSLSTEKIHTPEEDCRGRRRALKALAIAATLAMLVLSLELVRIMVRERPVVLAYTTDVGEQRLLTLKDGSSVVLDAQSRLEVAFSPRERTFRLQGQAFFNVAHDPNRPLRVITGAATIEAVGTEFNVRIDRLTQVAVLDGAVRVWPHGEPAGSQSTEVPVKSSQDLAAGQGVSIDPNGAVMERRRVDRAAVTAWEQRRLIFSRVALADIAREFNKYNRKPRLRVEGEVGALRFGGVFDASDPSPLLFILGRRPDISLERTETEIIIRESLRSR